MSDLSPLIVARLSGTTGELQRVPDASLDAYTAALLSWLPEGAVIARSSSGLVTPTLPQSQVFGRKGDGSFGGFGQAELDALLGLPGRLDGKANLVHGHIFQAISNIRWDTLQPNTRLAYIGGEFVWVAPSGGGGGVANPLEEDLALGGFALVQDGRRILRYDGVRAYILDVPVVPFVPGEPDQGDIYTFDGGDWVPRRLTGALIPIEVGGLGGTVETGLVTLVEGLAGKAPLGHTHDLPDIVGETPGKFVIVGPDGRLAEGDAPAGGGVGVQNPLTAPLDIVEHPIVSGSTEILRVQGGKILVGEREVFPSLIEDPTEGEVPVYDEDAETFVNRRLRGPEIELEAPVTVATDVEGAIAEVHGELDGKAPTSHAHALANVRGTTEGKFVIVGPAPNFPLQEVDPPSGGSGPGGTAKSDIDLDGHAVVDGGNGLLSQDAEGRALVAGHPIAHRGGTDPSEGQVFVFDPSTGAYKPGLISGDFVIVDRAGAPATAQATLDAIISALGTKATVGHGHAVADGKLVGTTPGRILSVGADAARTIIEIDPPNAGGPLASDLDIGDFAIVRGAQELLKVVGGKVYIDGQEVLPTQIDAPEDKQVPSYNADEERFENKTLAPGDIKGETTGNYLRVGSSGFLEEVPGTTGSSQTTIDGGGADAVYE